MHVTGSAVRRSPFGLAFRIVVVVLALLIVAFLAFDFWFYRAVQNSQAMRDGTLQLAGLVAPVIVTYDALGVPNICCREYSRSVLRAGLRHRAGPPMADGHDSALHLRRPGRDSGPEYLKYDRENRILGLRQVAETRCRRDGPADAGTVRRICRRRECLHRAASQDAAAGVPLSRLRSRVWTVEDSVLVGLSMTEFLNHWQYKHKLEREKILAKLGPELTADLFVNTSWRDHPPIPPQLNRERATRRGHPERRGRAAAPQARRPRAMRAKPACRRETSAASCCRSSGCGA